MALVFVSNPKIKALNKKYLKRNHATDVLAFDLSDGALPAKKHLQGDIIISTDAVIANARKFKTSLRYELALYIVHGILHLLGYDDHAAKDITRMRKKEQELMEHLNSHL